MLEIQNLSKKFGINSAVRGASMNVKRDEVFALIGPNGSGKSTIMKLVAGLLHPTDGNIYVGGLDTVKEPTKTKMLIGYIPDEPNVWPSMTGREFLEFTGALFGVEETECRERIEKLLPTFSLQGIEDEYFEDYSRGNKQKFTILAALLHHPSLLLIDEPIVGLDPESAETAKKMFVDFAKAGGTVLLVTHSLGVAEEIADRVGLLVNGEIRAAGTVAELRAQALLPPNAGIDQIYMAFTGKNLR